MVALKEPADWFEEGDEDSGGGVVRANRVLYVRETYPEVQALILKAGATVVGVVGE